MAAVDPDETYRTPAGIVELATHIGITIATITAEQRVTLMNDILYSYKHRQTASLLLYLYRRRCIGSNHLTTDCAADTAKRRTRVWL